MKNGRRKKREGREIFLAQLQYLNEDGREGDPESVAGGAVAVKEDAKRFCVTRNLLRTFAGYREEFLSDAPAGCISKAGPFYDDDILKGIMNKFYYFFRPIVAVLESEVPDFWFSLIIEPSYEDSSRIIITAETMTKVADLREIVVYSDTWKAWVPFCENGPADLYGALDDAINIMRKKISCFKCFLKQYDIWQASNM